MPSDQFAEIPALLTKLQSQISDLQPIMLEISETLRVAILRNFENEKDAATGKPWQRLAHRTIKQRTKAGHWPGKILQRTGLLKRSIISSAGTDFAQVSTNMVYAAIHNFGGIIHRSQVKTYLRKKREGKESKKPGGNKRMIDHPMSSFRVPARPFMTVNQATIDKIKNQITRHLTDQT